MMTDCSRFHTPDVSVSAQGFVCVPTKIIMRKIFYPPDFELYGCGLVNESSRLRLVSIHPCDCSLPELYMV